MKHAAVDLLADPDYGGLKSFLIETTGLAYYESRDDQLGPLLARHMARLRQPSCGDYLSLLRGPGGPGEVERLVSDLTIGETHFFRHRELFAALRDHVLPDLLRATPSGVPLRIWSAGCSIGAEAYSVSILLRRDLAPLVGDRPVSVLGTDINGAFLEQARRGRFTAWALRGLGDDVRQGCFAERGGEWEILPAYREGVSFRHHNLVADPYPAADLCAFDVVLCRNVMIYFEPQVIHRTLARLRQCLVPGGWLLLGHAEASPPDGFSTVGFPGALLYRRCEAHPAPAAETPAAVPAPRRRAAPRAAASPPPAPPAPPEARPPALDAARILSCFDRGSFEEAVRLCDGGLARDPFDPRAYYWRALGLEQMGKRGEAERDLRRVLYLDREHVLAHVRLARLIAGAGRGAEARRLLQAADRLLAARGPAERAGREEDLTAGELRALLPMLGGGEAS